MNRLPLLIKLMLLTLAFIIVLPLSADKAEAFMMKMSLEDLVGDADVIVVGTVNAITSSWNNEKDNIYSTLKVSVEDVLAGEAGNDTVKIIVPGGEVDGITQIVTTFPTFEIGEQAVLFLNKKPAQILPRRQYEAELYELSGHSQGKLEASGDEVRGMPLEDLEEGILNILENGNSDDVHVLEWYDFDDEPYNQYNDQFVYLGIRWPGPSPVVPYLVNASLARSNEIQAAANTWSNAEEKFSFLYSGTHSRNGRAALNGQNEIMWYDLGVNYILALATIWYEGSTILEADMVFNSRFQWSTSGWSGHDVQTVALHEFGHWLGLDHTDVYGSIMYPQIMGVQHHLHSVDIAGIQYIYGSGGSTDPTDPDPDEPPGPADPSAPVPENNYFADRITISGLNGSTAGSNVNAYKELGEPKHANKIGGQSVWWEWNAPESGNVAIDTIGSNFDTILAVYTGNSVSGLIPVAANDDYGGTILSRVYFEVNEGTSYKIAVDGWGSYTGDIVLNWLLTTENDTLAAPGQPVGPTEGYTEQDYLYSVEEDGSDSNHPLEYRFAWGDTSYSQWKSLGEAYKTWNNPGVYQVRVQARYSNNISVESPWSSAKEVNIVERPEDDIDSEWVILDGPDQDVPLDTSWLITFNKGFSVEEIDGIVIKRNNDFIPVSLNIMAEDKQVLVTSADSYQPATTYELRIFLNNLKRYKMLFNTADD